MQSVRAGLSRIELHHKPRIKIRILRCAAGLLVTTRVADYSALADAIVQRAVHVAVNPKIRFCNECIELRCIGSRDEIAAIPVVDRLQRRSEEHTSELQSLMRISYAVF